MRGFSRHPGPPGRWLSLAPVPLCSQPALAVLWLCWGSRRRRLQGEQVGERPQSLRCSARGAPGLGCAPLGPP